MSRTMGKGASKVMRRIPASIGTNAGLALARYVPWKLDVSKDEKTRQRFFQDVVAIPCSDDYESAFDRWKKAMEARKALRVTAELGGPLAVGLGNESAYEVGLTLHRIYGAPAIPGSAIKGACRRTAIGQQELDSIFGTLESSGGIVFHDAWYVPNSKRGPLACDTVTVHHPNYYQSASNRPWPTDFDDPVPVSFVSVPAGAQFFFAIEIAEVDEHWRNFVEELLKRTLTETGLGGKTNAGYGWFHEDITFDWPKSLPEQAEPYRRDIESLNNNTLGGIADRLKSIEPVELKRYVALAYKERVEKWLKKWTKDTEGKPWRVAIEEAII